MVVGRIFFGFGGESQSVAQSTLTALWFQDKELAMVYLLLCSLDYKRHWELICLFLV